MLAGKRPCRPGTPPIERRIEPVGKRHWSLSVMHPVTKVKDCLHPVLGLNAMS